METGPFNTPIALGREPFTAAFWVLVAPLLFPVIGMTLVTLAWPGFSDAIGSDAPSPEAISSIWMVMAAIHFAHFVVLSLWSERVGAGAFAGDMRVTPNWLIAAILLGPPILLAPNIIAGMIFGGTEGWEYNGDVNTSLFAPENWGATYIVFALLLAPILEEVTFRGVALGAMVCRGVPPWMAMVLSSAAFTFLHFQYSIPALVVVFVAGVGFAWLRLKSGSMMVPIAAHIAANATITFLASLAPPAG
ncbi:type II CAAX endopeptidase family protein [Henriciella sp. AS95]|uniref:CPBP family intramembrane glutamic endopeptidase n=1 Tax=Henriciella sp. AS95 TaxID=3135782 RepID=UPI00317FC9B1